MILLHCSSCLFEEGTVDSNTGFLSNLLNNTMDRTVIIMRIEARRRLFLTMDFVLDNVALPSTIFQHIPLFFSRF
jgi:hypothetical protein